MDPDRRYELLRNFTSPVAAITSREGDRRTGMISNSVVRASLVPECARVAFYCFKRHYSHELIAGSGRFCLHLLHRDQIELVRALGFESGRDVDKLADVDLESTDRGLPRLPDVLAWFDCRVVNAMDAGPSTFYLGEATQAGEHPRSRTLPVMRAAHFRERAPKEWMKLYRANKQRAQRWARGHLEIDPGSAPRPNER